MSCPLCLDKNIYEAFKKKDRRYGLKVYYHCNTCDLRFLPKYFHISKEDEGARYKTHNNCPDDVRYVEFLSRLVNPLKAKLEKGSEGLDFGCGPGPTIGVMLKGSDVKVFNYDPYFFDDKELLNRTYDFITCTEVVEHFCFPRNSWLRLKELLNANKSHLAVMTEVFESNQNFSDWYYHKDPTHVSFYSKKTLLWIANWLELNYEFPHKNVVIYSPN